MRGNEFPPIGLTTKPKFTKSNNTITISSRENPSMAGTTLGGIRQRINIEEEGFSHE
jgi:hypothetical protein